MLLEHRAQVCPGPTQEHKQGVVTEHTLLPVPSPRGKAHEGLMEASLGLACTIRLG